MGDVVVPIEHHAHAEFACTQCGKLVVADTHEDGGCLFSTYTGPVVNAGPLTVTMMGVPCHGCGVSFIVEVIRNDT